MRGSVPHTLDQQQQRFQAMYEASLPMVFGFLVVRVGGDRELAEDLTAETFAIAVTHFRKGKADEVTTPWLRTVAKRRLIDHWRRQHTAKSNRQHLLEVDLTQPGDALGDRQIVMAALRSLSKDQQAALVLQHIEGYTVSEVAETIGRSEKATESLLGRARQAFRKSYEEASA